MSNFSVNQNHPMIPNNQNFKLDRKLISVHSDSTPSAKAICLVSNIISLPRDLETSFALLLIYKSV